MDFLLVLAALQASSLAEPPRVRAAPLKCVCEEQAEGEAISVRGSATDAIVLYDEKNREALPRQATLFRVFRASGVEAKTPFKVWHVTDPDECGVAFDYGKVYDVVLRKVGEEYETDLCLMPSLAPPPQ